MNYMPKGGVGYYYNDDSEAETQRPGKIFEERWPGGEESRSWLLGITDEIVI